MSISVTQIGTASDLTGAATVSITTTGTVPGNALIVVLVTDRGAASGSISDTQSNSYVLVRQEPLNNDSTQGFLYVYYAANVASMGATDKITYTKGAPSYRTAVSAIYATNIQAALPIDNPVSNWAYGSSDAPSVTGSAVTSNSGELVIAAVGSQGSAGTFTQAVGYTDITESKSGTASTGARVNGGYYVVSGTATPTYAPSYSNSTYWADTVAAFIPSGGSSSSGGSFLQFL